MDVDVDAVGPPGISSYNEREDRGKGSVEVAQEEDGKGEGADTVAEKDAGGEMSLVCRRRFRAASAFPCRLHRG